MRISDWSSDVCSSDLFNTETLQYHVADRIELGSLTLNLGWKGYSVTNKATPIIASSFPSGTIKVEDWFQPHVGFNYELGDNAEVFGGFTQATRAFASATTTGPFSTNQAGFDAIGSASCRERVCQYVEISVVAGLLKKK